MGRRSLLRSGARGRDSRRVPIVLDLLELALLHTNEYQFHYLVNNFLTEIMSSHTMLVR
jgi:hypothetical protein